MPTLPGYDTASFAIVQPTDVVQRMATDPNITVNTPALQSAIPAAQLAAESAWGSRFTDSGQTLTDIFELNYHIHGIVPDGTWRLLLRQGFINTRIPYTVQVSRKWNGFGINSTPVDASTQTLDPSQYSLDPELGILYINGIDEIPFGVVGPGFVQQNRVFQNGWFVQMVYTAGFVSSDTNVPDWVKEACLSYVPAILNVANPNSKIRDVKAYTEVSHAMARLALAGHVRNKGLMTSPMFRRF